LSWQDANTGAVPLKASTVSMGWLPGDTNYKCEIFILKKTKTIDGNAFYNVRRSTVTCDLQIRGSRPSTCYGSGVEEGLYRSSFIGLIVKNLPL